MIHRILPIQYCFSSDFKDYQECVVNYKNISVLYYQFYTSDDHTVVIADGCADIQFCCDENGASSTVWGSVLNPQYVKFNAGTTYYGMRLSTSISRRFSLFHYSELINQGALLSEINADWKVFSDKIVQAKSFKERIALSQNLLSKFDVFTPSPMDYVDFSINKILENSGCLKISDLADSIGISERLLREKFTCEVGMSPKQYSRIVRFQNIIENIVVDDKGGLHSNGASSGMLSNLVSSYYDESHLSKEVKYFTDMTPKVFMEKKANLLMKRKPTFNSLY